MNDIITVHKQFYGHVIRHWPLVLDLARRDLSARYRGSSLGFLWTFLNPLLLMLIYSVVFRYISKVSIPNYPLYIMIGVLVWQGLAGGINEAAYAIQSSHGLVTKTPLPIEIIPVKVVVAQMLNFALSFTIYVAFSVLIFQRGAELWLMFPFFMVLMGAFLLFVAVPVSLIAAVYKDVQQLIANVLTVLFFTTPVVYDYNALPPKAQKLLLLHPMAQLVRIAQELLFYDRWPTPVMVLSVLAFIVFLEVVAVYVCFSFRRIVAERV